VAPPSREADRAAFGNTCDIDGLSKSQLRIGADRALDVYIYRAVDVSIGAMWAMAYNDVGTPQVTGLTQDGNRRDFLAGEPLLVKLSSGRLRHVMALLDKAVRELQPSEEVAHDTILLAVSLLRKQIDPEGAPQVPEEGGRLLAWQARKVRDYIDSHLTDPLLVGDLCTLIQRSEAHFSRSFKRTFGVSPRAFVIRRRLELAARCMLQTEASLSEISARCGFTDQAHLCKHFRQVMGQTPAAWRRARKSGAPCIDGPQGVSSPEQNQGWWD